MTRKVTVIVVLTGAARLKEVNIEQDETNGLSIDAYFVANVVLYFKAL